MSAARTALVTGATGLVGRHIAEHLLEHGWDVRALVRGPAPELAALGVEPALGDVLDGDSFTNAARGRSVIFHNAAVVTSSGGWEAFRRPNIDGTLNAIAAAEHSAARLVQLSSVAVYGGKDRYRAAEGGVVPKTDENTLLAPLPASAHYARSKRESEQLVMTAHADGRIWATAVRPDVIYGAHDRQFVPRLARILRHGVAPAIGGGRTTLAIVHAANVADGAVRAALHDEAGGRAYNLANDYDVTVRDFFRLAGEGLGVRVRFVPIPLAPARAVYNFGIAAVTLVTAGRMNIMSGSMDFLTRDNPFTSERARRELGWSPIVRPEAGVPDAFRWWSERHSVKP